VPGARPIDPTGMDRLEELVRQGRFVRRAISEDDAARAEPGPGSHRADVRDQDLGGRGRDTRHVVCSAYQSRASPNRLTARVSSAALRSAATLVPPWMSGTKDALASVQRYASHLPVGRMTGDSEVIGQIQFPRRPESYRVVTRIGASNASLPRHGPFLVRMQQWLRAYGNEGDTSKAGRCFTVNCGAPTSGPVFPPGSGETTA
jgi:hypothetical protein